MFDRLVPGPFYLPFFAPLFNPLYSPLLACRYSFQNLNYFLTDILFFFT